MRRALISLAALLAVSSVVSAQGIFPSGAVSGGGDLTLYSQSALNIATQTTAEEILKSVSIPGETLTPGGGYYGFTVFATISAAANTNQKTPRFRLGGISGTVIAAHANDAASANRYEFNCVFVVTGTTSLDGQCNNSRVSGASYLYGPNIAAVTFDFTQALDVTITGESATAAGNLTLTALRVALLKKTQ